MRLSRKARRERDADIALAIQQAEESPRVRTADAEAVSKFRDYDRLQRELDRHHLDPAPEGFSCERHAWGVAANGRLRPPASMCPHCQKDAEKGRRPEDSEADVRQRPVEVHDPRYVSKAPNAALADEITARKRAEQIEQGIPVAGSPYEAAILDRIDAEREDMLAREGRGRRPVFTRIESGQLVSYYDPRTSLREASRGLVRRGA